MTDLLQQEITTKLSRYQKDYQEYTKCLIRGIQIPINGRPEELVRQIFIHFLIKESRLFPDIINIAVEANNHDIEIYKKQNNDDFKPHQYPLIIVEVKREGVNLKNHYNQIQRYLKNACCYLGILYNYHEIIAFNRKNDHFEIHPFKSLKDIQALILKINNNDYDDDLLEFKKAQNGNFDSFAYLISRYGNYTTNTVVFKVKQQQAEIEGYFFNMQGNKVYYDVCGKDSKKQSSFESQDFEKLISITY
ncbi:MAG: type I restriction enzyme HsdR N-terminal domain-containing protein [Nostoc sp. NMS1]|uniref:type I restriction enzyme HsdR N-terminal domain-containing protein n=1 Tax=unclassified Nostoc TaxID=2593658 RepID=UPI0025ECD837|nr:MULTISPECIES: type I restriction enzyme HsdR N-terminal domain-containing protein [unclassified Nostoc]MBN3906899.1 type I restriction enzyme HsdR N-terminal domain-containing protein [Nostoc sp. NMS1]MBN3991559.1 type I restriction enzyme HsdR N-terminal domain-containing protein [Nostoc sp. NMS2]